MLSEFFNNSFSQNTRLYIANGTKILLYDPSLMTVCQCQDVSLPCGGTRKKSRKDGCDYGISDNKITKTESTNEDRTLENNIGATSTTPTDKSQKKITLLKPINSRYVAIVLKTNANILDTMSTEFEKRKLLLESKTLKI